MEKFSVVSAKLLETVEKNFCIYYTVQRQLKIIPVDKVSRLFLTAIISYQIIIHHLIIVRKTLNIFFPSFFFFSLMNGFLVKIHAQRNGVKKRHVGFKNVCFDRIQIARTRDSTYMTVLTRNTI